MSTEKVEINDFLKELTALINKHNKENTSNTPDYILAIFLDECLKAFDSTTILRTTRIELQPRKERKR